MRALDLLEADPRVDANQLGINGVSGGGACSFHTAIADTRVKAVSTLCGICSPYDAIANWHLTGHCECMFPINLYKRDISVYAGLIAPRAVQFGFALHDSLFHPEETRALAHRARTAYTLLGCEDRWKLVEAPGPHGNQPAFDAAAAKWFDLHLAGVEQPPLKVAKPVFTESEISVFNGTPPAPDRLDILPQLLTPYGTLPLPSKPDEWPEIRQSAVSRLRAAVPCLSTLEEERRSQLKVSADWRYNGELKSSSTILLQGEIQGVGVRLRLYAPAGAVRKLLLAVGSEGEYLPWIDGRVHPLLPDKCVNVAGLQARLAGANLPPEPKTGAPGLPPLRNYYVRAMQLLGTSTVAMTFHDIGVALNALAECDGTSGCEIYLYGCGDSGIAALYRGILDDRVSGVIVEDVPASHRYGAPLPGVLRAFDLQHAFGLLAPRKIAMVNRGYKRCLWAQRLYERLGCPGNCLHAADLRQALAFML